MALFYFEMEVILNNTKNKREKLTYTHIYWIKYLKGVLHKICKNNMIKLKSKKDKVRRDKNGKIIRHYRRIHKRDDERE